MNLRGTTRKIISQLEEKSGYPVQVVEDLNLPVFTSLKVARGSLNKVRDFHPDFMFWVKRWNDYFILFVDPQGMKNADCQYKIDDYKKIFVDQTTQKMKIFPYRGMNVRVALAMYNKDASEASQGYSDYWYDHPKQILKHLIPDK